MTRALVLSPEPVRDRMAGMGIRALKVAETLRAHGHEVTLAAAGGVDGQSAGDLRALDLHGPGFAGAARGAELAVASGHTAERLYGAGFEGALVADLYDPFLVENLSYAGTLGPGVLVNDRRALFLLCDRADLVLAASEEQRLFYLGLLLGRRRLDAATLGADPELRRTVAVAPFGVSEAAPGPARPHPTLGAGGHDVLFGGVYDWYDPDLVLEAWPRVVASVPDARLVFSTSPNPASTPQERLAAARQRAGEAGLLGRSVFVVEWVPYAERGGFYRSFRAAVLVHRPSLEAALSFRTRVLDYLWAGLPAVATEGGAASRLLQSSGAGLVVPPRPEDLARALVALLTDDELHRSLSGRATEAARDLTWSRTLAPLLEFASAPVRRKRPSRLASAVSGVARRLAR